MRFNLYTIQLRLLSKNTKLSRLLYFLLSLENMNRLIKISNNLYIKMDGIFFYKISKILSVISLYFMVNKKR